MHTVLITGCTPGGIGHALAREFHARGLQVFATARQTSKISDLAALGISTFELEVTDAQSISTLRDAITAETGGSLDMLINNAGRNYTVPALDVSMSEIRSVFETNLFSVMMMCQAFAPLLIRSGGTIVQIGSVAGVTPYVFGSVYNASKAALHSYSDALRVELAPLGVRVVTVITGGVISNIARTHISLPPNSYYLPLEKEYELRQTHSQANGIPNEEYAKFVVQKVLGSKQNVLWAGGKSWLAWFGTYFLPKWVVDAYMTRMCSLWKLKQANMKKST
ncbi:short chain dehydrogenase/reductase-like protein [Piedraia hortae CBS 480.64]|uniref:Short chain dehydrogenase/reductase-like protein n=1 Tax=Piedraia hortae CBS 480.64 TaxID=1314780 RepID=A0A6A7BTF8_9PEZI|nr:short chain dehydrogenase/reductase-like protein [Piedraia hortae CBS 480.64]